MQCRRQLPGFYETCGSESLWMTWKLLQNRVHNWQHKPWLTIIQAAGWQADPDKECYDGTSGVGPLGPCSVTRTGIMLFTTQEATEPGVTDLSHHCREYQTVCEQHWWPWHTAADRYPWACLEVDNAARIDPHFYFGRVPASPPLFPKPFSESESMKNGIRAAYGDKWRLRLRLLHKISHTSTSLLSSTNSLQYCSCYFLLVYSVGGVLAYVWVFPQLRVVPVGRHMISPRALRCRSKDCMHDPCWWSAVQQPNSAWPALVFTANLPCRMPARARWYSRSTTYVNLEVSREAVVESFHIHWLFTNIWQCRIRPTPGRAQFRGESSSLSIANVFLV